MTKSALLDNAPSTYFSVAIVLSAVKEALEGKVKPYPEALGFSFPVISKLPLIFLSAILKPSPLYYMNISVDPIGYISVV